MSRTGLRRGPRLFRVHDWRVRTKLGAVLTIPLNRPTRLNAVTNDFLKSERGIRSRLLLYSDIDEAELLRKVRVSR